MDSLGVVPDLGGAIGILTLFGTGLVPGDCTRRGVLTLRLPEGIPRSCKRGSSRGHAQGAGFSPSAPWRDALGRGFGQNTPRIREFETFYPVPSTSDPRNA